MDRAARRRVFRLSVGSAHVERDVDQELAFHVEMRTRKLIAEGLDPESARARAIEQFGDLRAVRAECVDIDNEKERAVRRTSYLSDLRQDVAYALRAMRHNAGFTAVVLLTLALGIGANTSTFTLIDALLLRTIPVSQPNRLVTIGNPSRTGGLSEGSPRNDIASYPVFTDVRDARTRSAACTHPVAPIGGCDRGSRAVRAGASTRTLRVGQLFLGARRARVRRTHLHAG